MTDKSNIKNKAINAVIWSGSLQIISQFFTFILGVILARLLTPEDFGLVAMVLIFTAFSNLLTDFGLSSALIQKKHVSNIEYFSSFWFTVVIGILLTLLMIFCSQTIANIFNTPQLRDISFCIAPIFLANAICSVPKAKLSKRLAHKKIAGIELVASLVGALSAIVAALLEMSYWSLVVQILVTNSLRALLFLLIAKLNLQLIFSLGKLKPLFIFSANVFATQSLMQITKQTDKVILGKFFDSMTLGLYNKAQQLMMFPINNISRTVANVLFPTFSSLQGNKQRISDIYLKAIACIALFTFPMMVGLMIISPYFIAFVLGDNWIDMTPFLQFFCLIGITTSIASITGTIYLSLGRSALQLKVNLINQPIQILGLVVGMKFGVMGMMTGYYISHLLGVVITWSVVVRLLNISLLDIFKSLLSSIFPTIIMAAVTLAVDFKLPSELDNFLRLLSLLVIAFLSYIVMLVLIRPIPFQLITNIFKEKFSKSS